MNFLLIFFTSLIFTIFFTPYFISYLRRSKVVDLPGNRRIHTSITPRMGGLLIFLVVSIMLISFASDLNSIRLVIIAANIVLLTGIFDDMLGLNYSAKIILQMAASILLIIYLAPKFTVLKLFEIEIPYPLNYIMLGLFILGTMNSINLLDGMDGLVSGFSLLICSIILALAIISNNTFLLIVTTSLMGALLGFLKYNVYTAKIFLGDTGSLTLGFFLVLSSLLITLDYKENILDLTFSVILLAIPIVDTIKVMLQRILRGQNPFLPDRTHIHHIIHELNISQKFTVFIIESFTVIFIILSLYYIKVSHFVPLIIFFITLVALLNIKPILKLVVKMRQINFSPRVINHFPAPFLLRMEKSLIGMSTLIIGFIIVSSFPNTTNLNPNLIILFFIIGLVMFLLAYGHQKKSKDISDIYTFINLAAFFTITNLNSSALFDLSSGDYNLSQVTEISYYALAMIVVLFLIASEKLFAVKKVVLNGIDLTVIVFILLIMIVNSFIKFHFDEFFSISFLEAFIFYLWYKVIVSIKQEITSILFYASFALPFAALLTLFFI